MKLTVFGASGRTGRLVVRHALDAGHDVTAVVRDPARLPIHDSSLDVVTADVTDPDALRPALQGRDAAISAIGATTRKDAGIAASATEAILDGLHRAGVHRFVAVSASPLAPPPVGERFFWRAVITPMLQSIYRDVYADLASMEAALRDSGIDWTVVRPPRLTNGKPTGRYRTRIDGNVPKGRSISRGDLAAAILAFVNDPTTLRHAIGVSS